MEKKEEIIPGAKLIPETEGFIHIDATPDNNYPLRILRAYRERCNTFWSDSSDPNREPDNPLCKAMNEHQRQRAIILNKAIKILEEA